MLFLDGLDGGGLAEVQGVDFVAYIKCRDGPISHECDIDVLICVTADMKIPWDFLHREATNQPTAIIFLESFSCHLNLF